MKQTSWRWQLSRWAGIGARRVAATRPSYPQPSRLPVGHPHLGLRDRWYLVTTSASLGEEPHGVRLLGEDLVLWRSGPGRLSLMRDYCPHRGGRLSLGDVVDGELRCWYHGWAFAADGQCAAIPLQGGTGSLQRRTRVESVYPVVERAGFVWAWIGDADPVPLELPEELVDPTYAVIPETVEWQANWLLALENVADLLHAPYLHARSLTLSRGVREDRVRVEDTPVGFRVERVGQQGVNFDWVEISTGALMWMRLDIPYPSSWVAGPGPDLRILGFATPVDEARTLVHFPRLRRVSGWQRWLWRSLYRLRLRGTHLHVLNQDKMMLESIRTLDEGYRNEHLAQSDKPVTHLRQALTPAMDAQLAAVEGRESAVWIGHRAGDRGAGERGGG